MFSFGQGINNGISTQANNSQGNQPSGRFPFNETSNQSNFSNLSFSGMNKRQNNIPVANNSFKQINNNMRPVNQSNYMNSSQQNMPGVNNPFSLTQGNNIPSFSNTQTNSQSGVFVPPSRRKYIRSF